MKLDTRARRLQELLHEIGVSASVEECRDMIIADFVERILAMGVDPVPV